MKGLTTHYAISFLLFFLKSGKLMLILNNTAHSIGDKEMIVSDLLILTDVLAHPLYLLECVLCWINKAIYLKYRMQPSKVIMWTMLNLHNTFPCSLIQFYLFRSLIRYRNFAIAWIHDMAGFRLDCIALWQIFFYLEALWLALRWEIINLNIVLLIEVRVYFGWLFRRGIILGERFWLWFPWNGFISIKLHFLHLVFGIWFDLSLETYFFSLWTTTLI